MWIPRICCNVSSSILNMIWSPIEVSYDRPRMRKVIRQVVLFCTFVCLSVCSGFFISHGWVIIDINLPLQYLNQLRIPWSLGQGYIVHADIWLKLAQTVKVIWRSWFRYVKARLKSNEMFCPNILNAFTMYILCGWKDFNWKTTLFFLHLIRWIRFSLKRFRLEWTEWNWNQTSSSTLQAVMYLNFILSDTIYWIDIVFTLYLRTFYICSIPEDLEYCVSLPT